ncbi:MAG: alkyl hydroperoxide reductase [Bacteroidetes bacterium HGW-Bacteroidetes-9]|nr:MAG: alkyl hydroperoxide reductase [Bacteroidetes bacterium HGW-Bacteroidetes-9]
MKPTAFVLFLLLLLTIPVMSQDVKVVDFKGLEPVLNLRNDTTYVVNFWATWCIPCIKELPYFQKIDSKYKDENVKVLLVSLDFLKHIDTRLRPFIEKHEIIADVMLMNDPDSNSWIDKVSPDWSGALPATVIYNRNFRAFYEKSFTYEELQSIINQNLIKK